MVAGRLAEAGHDVTLVEAGAGDGRRCGTSFFDTLAAPGAAVPGPFVRGRGLGGSGAVNGMVATPGDLAQYERGAGRTPPTALARVRVPIEPADASSARSTGAARRGAGRRRAA